MSDKEVDNFYPKRQALDYYYKVLYSLKERLFALEKKIKELENA